LRTSSRLNKTLDAPARYRALKIFKITGTYTFEFLPWL
jgi:hypothetical protein